MSEQSLLAGSSAVDVAAAVAELHLDRWPRIRRLLTVRVAVTEDGIGVRPLGFGLGLQVVLTLPVAWTQARGTVSGRLRTRYSATIGVDQLPVDRWGVGWESIWGAAVANTRRLVRPTMRTAASGSFRFLFIGGSTATSGVVADLDHFVAPHLGPPDQLRGPEHGWWSALSQQSVVVIRRTEQGSTACLPGGLDTVADLVAHFRSLTAEPFPINLFALPAPRH